MKALRTTSDGPRARSTVTDATPGKRTLVEAHHGDVLPRAPGSGTPRPLGVPVVPARPTSLGAPSPAPQAAPQATPSGPQVGSQLPDKVGNAPSGELVGAPPLDAPWSTPRLPSEAADLALDCVGAITLTESGGHAQESHLHTASGVRASYANVAQQITSKTVGVLGGFDKDQLAELGLDKGDLKEATGICAAVRKIWNAAVGERTATTVEELRQQVSAKTLQRSRLTDEDLQRMLRGGEFFALLRERQQAEGGAKKVAGDKEKRAEIADEVAQTEIAHELNMRQTDVRTYLGKGFKEDMAAWMRVAVERPPVGGEDDQLGDRIRAAAEDEGGWRMARIDIEGAVKRHLQASPLDSDIATLAAAVDHHAQGASKGYFAKVKGHFEDLRADRAAGQPWSPPGVTDTDPDTSLEEKEDDVPASDQDNDPVAAAMKPNMDWLMVTAGAFAKLSLGDSVGEGGKNDAPDVRRVVIRLQFLGRLGQGVDLSSLGAAIHQFQRDAAGMKYGDGRIDPGGKTLPALNARMTGLMTDPSTDDPVTPDVPTPTPDVPTPTPDVPTPTPTPTPTPDVPTPTPTPTPATPTPASGPLPLVGSVGAGGKNIPTDVMVVRVRLQQLGYDAGTTDETLVNAIREFQSRVTNHKISKCDGRVDPGSHTAQALASGAAPAVISVADPTALVEASNHPEVVLLRLTIEQLAGIEAAVAEDKNEEAGAARDDLVARIGATRRMVESMPLMGLSSDEAAAVRAWAHRQLNQLSPYYSQGRNVDFLELYGHNGDGTRTCNLTSLAMTLEALGKSPADYKGSLETIRAIRSYRGSNGDYNYKKTFDKGAGVVGDDVLGLRLPDFLQLATVARRMAAGNKLLAAVKHAWDDILYPSVLAELANDFGANSWIHAGVGGKGSRYEDFQEAFGAELDRGHQIVLFLGSHFVRLQAVTPDGLIVDDPGKFSKKNRSMSFKEAKGSIYQAIVVA